MSDTSTPELAKLVETFGHPLALHSMPRPPRLIAPGLPHHVTQRGNYRQQVFFRDEDRQSYLHMLKEYSRQCTGHLWQARYGSVVLDECHFWTAMVYVEQNPVRAGLVEHAGAWRWSSATAHLKNAGDGWLDLSAWRLRFNIESWERCLQLGLTDA